MDGKFLIRGKGVHIWLGVCLCFLEFCSYAPVYILLPIVNVPKKKKRILCRIFLKRLAYFLCVMYVVTSQVLDWLGVLHLYSRLETPTGLKDLSLVPVGYTNRD